MSSNENILFLASQVRNFNPEAAERQPSVFLSLAPTTSASYPQPRRPSIKQAEPTTKTEVAETSTAATTAPVVQTTEVVDVKPRRSSSLSSSSSKGSGLRFLKLSPVHWGEHQDDHQLDWNEAAIE